MFPAYKDTKPALLVKAALDLLHAPGQVFEIRIPKTKAGTLSGYYDDTTLAAAAVARENGKHPAIYTTLNPVAPELIARSENGLKLFDPRTSNTTSDGEIVSRRWFAIDLDPIRPAGISSTDEEVSAAREVAGVMVEWLSTLGWPEPLQACSGNGWHVLYRVDAPNDDQTRTDFEFALKSLSMLFSTDKVHVDTTVFNAARVWKIYGTVSAKGSSTADRPHRVAMLQYVPSTLDLLSIDKIAHIASSIRDAKSEEFKDFTGEYISDMVKWLSDRGQTVISGPRPMFGNEGQKWVLSRCPFNTNHHGPIVGLVNNRPVYKCLHNSCSSFKWKEFREKIDPTYKDPDTVKTRLIAWGNSDQPEPDLESVQSICALGKKSDGVLKAIKKEIPRDKYTELEALVKSEKRRYLKDVIGDGNEKGNIVGLIRRTMTYQEEGIVPMYWTADYDHRVRVGTIGDPECARLSEEHEIDLMIKFHSLGDSWVKQTYTSQVIKHLAAQHRTNPLRAHLKRLRWDGIQRIDTWLPDYMGTEDNEYNRAIGRKWLISAVARAMEPGCQADHMLIFEGPQGCGKSTAARILGGQFYLEYVGDLKNGGHGIKDMVHAMLGKMIVEMSELATIRKSEIETLKAILTTTADDIRLSYERDAKTYPRTCVFIGTTNAVRQSYIADSTGARRFWPTEVAKTRPVNTALLKRDVEQIWAEAVEAYEDGENWYEVPKDAVLAEQHDRQILVQDSDPWFSRINSSLTDSDSYSNGVYVIHTDEVTKEQILIVPNLSTILGAVLGIDAARQSSADAARLQNILKAIGFMRGRRFKRGTSGAHTFELNEAAIPHLWAAIETAHKMVKFPKQTESQ